MRYVLDVMYMEMFLRKPQEYHHPLRTQVRTGQGRAGWVGRAGGKQRGKLFLPSKVPSDFCNHEKGFLGSFRLKHLHLSLSCSEGYSRAPCLTAPIGHSSLSQLGGCQSQPAQGGFPHSAGSSSPTALPAVSRHVTHSPAP